MIEFVFVFLNMVGTDILLLFLECLYIGLALAMQHWLLLVGSLDMQKQV